ncbi:hypothetical protein Ait01nite_035940 [Actinoplanes italicus]|uniref:hypothetical protein n=1 Tax=Actinoplanes italicus TaxID=113567 RepID=UPI001942487C|nr:hypothetical protein [Actinoplanes italicus]GIE30549.1 hypothetical protein Ait01nite_035940 [Actinoplanes italicus]
MGGLLALTVTGGGIGWLLAAPDPPLPDPVVTTTSPDASPSPSDTSPTPYTAVEPLLEESSPSPTPEESSESPSPEPEPVRDFADGFKVYSEEGYGRFVTPSGNIACYLDEDFARCDIRERDWTGEESSTCEQEYGDALGVKGTESYFICHGDTLDFDSTTLSYGEAIEVGDYICTSSDTGVLCANKSTGDGFTMSRSDYELF